MSTIKTDQEVDDVKKYETVVSSGQSALKALMTMNGGATIAFLTFMGHLWDRGTLRRESTDVLVDALGLFIGGTFFVGVAYGTIFITNCLSRYARDKSSDRMFGFTVLCCAASLVCFLSASWFAVQGFKTVTRLLP